MRASSVSAKRWLSGRGGVGFLACASAMVQGSGRCLKAAI